MVRNSLFAQTIEWDNARWYLQYDPADSMSVLPDLSSGRIVDVSCTEVSIPGAGADKHYFMVIADIEIPAVMYGGKARASQLLKAFRIYDHRPPEPTGVSSLQLPEMVFYLREPAPAGSTAQSFLDTALGQTLSEAAKQDELDRTWSSRLYEPEPAETSQPVQVQESHRISNSRMPVGTM